MPKLVNLARMTTLTTGTGTISLQAAVSGYLSFADAGVSNGDIVYYGIIDGANSEVGVGTYTSAGTTLTRTVTASTNSNNAINLSGTAEVVVTGLAAAIAMHRLGASSPNGVATVSFSSIGPEYSALKIIGIGRSTAAGTGTDGIQLRFNGDTGANYASQAGNANQSSGTGFQLTAQTSMRVAELIKAGDIATYPCGFEILIPFYTTTTFNKVVLSHYSTINNTNINNLFDITVSAHWASTSAVTSMELFTASGSNYVTGTEFRLYGIV